MITQPIAVLGAGHSGCAMAADLSFHGYKVNFYEIPKFANSDIFEPILEKGTIEIIGAGPKRQAKIHKITTDIKEALADVRLIFLSMSAEGHLAFFKEMAPHLKDGQVVVIMPGNFGSLKLHKLLQEKNPSRKVIIYETTLPFYAARVIGPAKVNMIWRWGPNYKPEDDLLARNVFIVAASALPAKDNGVAIQDLQEICPEIVQAKNILVVWLSNPSNLFHPICTLLNLGFVEHDGDNFFLWRDGATPSVIKALQAVADEIDSVARAFGVKTARFKGNEKIATAMEDYFGPTGALSTAQGPGTIRSRYLAEDVLYGLVPISQLAKKAGMSMPIVDGLIAITSAIYQEDCYKAGQNLEKLGLAGLSREQIIKLIEG